ncbi:Rha family transcriptional regulator [Xanthobacter sp. V4C-4]|uniref:Rha family transcriptional regulator n=1 Tax=Xanthobacter cornucopiae TaxID=3119924 RepID=UPI00372CBDAA
MTVHNLPAIASASTIAGSILPTTGAASGEPLTMSSREIAELLGSRHDNVKRTIERLTNRSAISYPPTEEYLDTTGRKATEYRLDKRSSLIVVAQLSPEFTARVVDRWQELEAQLAGEAPAFRIPQTLPEALRLAAEQAERAVAAEEKLAIAGPKAETLDVLTNSEGLFYLMAAAKKLVAQRDLTPTRAYTGTLPAPS